MNRGEGCILSRSPYGRKEIFSDINNKTVFTRFVIRRTVSVAVVDKKSTIKEMLANNGFLRKIVGNVGIIVFLVALGEPHGKLIMC
jgi:hypothetical protein